MKAPSFRPKDLLVRSLAVVVAYAILFQIVARTRMIEKIMAFTFSWWELLLIAGFIVARLATYLLVPAVLVSVFVFIATRWCFQKRHKAGQ